MKGRLETMSLTKAQVREILSTAGVDAEHMAEAVDKIIDGHKTSIEALREERDGYKSDAEKLPDVQKELDELREKVKDGNKDPYEPKYNDLKEEFEKYRAEVEAKETTAKKQAAYRQLLKDVGISEKRIDTVMKVSDLSELELDDKLAIKDAEKLSENVKKEWADFIQTTGEKGADTATPPENTGGNDGQPSRAAQLAQKYHEDLYGKREDK